MPCRYNLQFGKVGHLPLPASEREVRLFFHLRVTMVVAIPSCDFTSRCKPDFAVALGIADEFPQQKRSKRPPADKRVIAPHHELWIGLAFLEEAIKAILPHLQQIPRCPAGPLAARIVVQILEIG